jgi:hypothetical protein
LKNNKTSHNDAISFIQALVSIVTIIDGNNQTVIASINNNFSDFEDGVQAELAYMHHCDYIITNNTKDFAKSHIKAMSP